MNLGLKINRSRLEIHILHLLSKSTVAGVNKISKATSLSVQRFWLTLIIIATAGCILLCKKGYSEYMSYAVRTNVAFDVYVDNHSLTMEKSLIPNLVFCHHKTIKKSVFNTDPMAKEYYYKLVGAYMPADDNVTHWRREFVRYCAPSLKYESLPAIDFAGLASNTKLYERLIDLASQVMTSRRDVLLKCFWRGREFACNAPTDPTMITDVYTDDTLCFHFQYDSRFIDNNSFDSRQSFIPSKPHDLTLFLDTKQNQRCGHVVPEKGEGFSVSAIDSHSLFDTNVLQKRFHIHPGFEYVAKIRTVKTVRNTEHLGRCRSDAYYSTNRSIPPVEYTKTYCQGFAWLRKLYRKCECMPPMPDWSYPYLNPDNIGMDIDPENLCSKSLKLLSCLLDSIVSESMAAFVSKDSTCLDACVELNPVSSVLIKRKLTTLYVENFKASVSNMSAKEDYPTLENWVERNAIVLHIDFETRKFEVMIENQVFTFLDLLRYLASTCSLFFGMSCISFFEIVFIILRVFFYCFLRQ